jgi:Transposase DDE domain
MIRLQNELGKQQPFVEGIMRSRRNFKLSAREIQGHAERLLAPVLGKAKKGRKWTVSTLLPVVLVAAARMTSLFAACWSLQTLSDETVRQGLRVCFPRRFRRLEEKLNWALLEPLPKKTRRRPRVLAIDMHEIPYHGETDKPRDLVHKKPKDGTTKFFAYATVCLVEAGYRYTLGYTWVRQKEKDTAVVQRLLACVAPSGIAIKRLLLDRGFFNVALMQFLQAQNVPFLMPVVFRGRKPKRGKRHTGLRALLRQKAGWYEHCHRWKGQEVRFRACVAYKSYRHHRSGRRYSKKLVYAAWRVRGTPQQVREEYRRRFAIETSYRQLGQARIRTSTRDPLLRLFFVGVALLLRNLWVWLQWLLFGEPSRPRPTASKRFQLKAMLCTMARVIEQHLPLDPQLT